MVTDAILAPGNRPLLLSRPFRRPCDVRRQLRRLMTTVNEQHVHVKLGGRTAAHYRRSKQLRKLPADFTVEDKLFVAVGKVTFIRLVASQGTVRILGQSFKVGKCLKYQYVKVTIYTKYQKLKVYSKGKLIKEFSYPRPKR
jgi:hypothetical protein